MAQTGPFGMNWTAIVLTCKDKKCAGILKKELKLRQEKGLIHPDTVTLCVEDPKAKVGSGGATINALLVVAEHLSARMGFTVVNTDILRSSRILIMHAGRHFPFDACTRTFTCLPATFRGLGYHHVLTNWDALYHIMSTKIAVGSPCGVWACSTDMYLSMPEMDGNHCIDWDQSIEVCVVSMSGTVDYAKNHGVYKISEGKQSYLLDIAYKADSETMKNFAREDGSVALASGIVYFNPSVAETLLLFGTTAQLYACTYMGLDSGLQPLELSLFFDFLTAMACDVKREEFISGQQLRQHGITKRTSTAAEKEKMRQAREVIWRELRDFEVTAVVMEGGEFNYFTPTASDHHRVITAVTQGADNTIERKTITHSSIHPSLKIDNNSIIINSILEEGAKVGAKSMIINSHLTEKVSFGKDSIINGIRSDDFKGFSSRPIAYYKPLLQSVSPASERADIFDCLHVIRLGYSVSRLTAKLQLHCFFQNFSCKFSDSIVIQNFPLFISSLDNEVRYTLTVFGKFDDILSPSWKCTATFCNMPWMVFQNKTGITPEDLWGPDLPDDEKCVYTAQLFPVLHITEEVGLAEILWLQNQDVDEPNLEMLRRWRSSWRLSLKDILHAAGLEKEFEKRRQLSFEITKRIVEETLISNGNTGLLSLYRTACLEGFQHELLATLDEVAFESAKINSAALAARTFAHIADALACMAGREGGLQSGPAANVHWKQAFQHLEDGDLNSGIQAMKEERKNWLSKPDLLVRAARHYEGAAQILIRKVVSSGRKFIKTTSCYPLVPFDKVVIAECPARVDIMGGWSDTPPITYEHGGAVINAAILIDGKKPIGSSAQRIEEPVLILTLDCGSGSDVEVTLKTLEDLSDYSQPHAVGALLKAGFVCAELIEYPSETSLSDQLTQKYGGGFKVKTWSHLPRGSGMGTSSILAGALMAALWTAAGKKYDRTALMHAVLWLEQMLTTGGGWQDQVGGLVGGIKVGHSAAKLPLFVDHSDLNIAPDVISAFNNQFILVYTGKTRLAKNLLQDVIRNWYNRDPQMVETANQLVEGAWTCAKAFQEGDLEKVGAFMNTYWSLKKRMAPGSEPLLVKQMMDVLRPHVLGMCLAGAGGGGFMYVLTKEPYSMKLVKSVLRENMSIDKVSFHRIDVDPKGLDVQIRDCGAENGTGQTDDQENSTRIDIEDKMSAKDERILSEPANGESQVHVEGIAQENRGGDAKVNSALIDGGGDAEVKNGV